MELGSRPERLIEFKPTSQCNRKRFAYRNGCGKKKRVVFLGYLLPTGDQNDSYIYFYNSIVNTDVIEQFMC